MHPAYAHPFKLNRVMAEPPLPVAERGRVDPRPAALRPRHKGDQLKKPEGRFQRFVAVFALLSYRPGLVTFRTKRPRMDRV
jgi:hypothetical protein